jgi:3-dehydroquinate dehydratase-2
MPKAAWGKMKPIFVLNGPNLNMLGLREPAVYGTATLKDIEDRCRQHGAALGLDIDFRQSNHEGDLVSWIHEARETASAIAINAGAYTHSSIALHDALKSAGLAAVEVHLSNVHARESFRHTSMIAPAVSGVICGFGAESYLLAISALYSILTANKKA